MQSFSLSLSLFRTRSRFSPCFFFSCFTKQLLHITSAAHFRAWNRSYGFAIVRCSHHHLLLTKETQVAIFIMLSARFILFYWIQFAFLFRLLMYFPGSVRWTWGASLYSKLVVEMRENCVSFETIFFPSFPMKISFNVKYCTSIQSQASGVSTLNAFNIII